MHKSKIYEHINRVCITNSENKICTVKSYKIYLIQNVFNWLHSTYSTEIKYDCLLHEVVRNMDCRLR